MNHYIAIDWGATSGRVIVAHVENERVNLEEVHRFEHRFSEDEDGHYYWEFNRLMEETIIGLRKASEMGYRYDSIGVDTWGVDVVFYDEEGKMLAEPLAYRDPFTSETPSFFFDNYITADQLYRKTGIQFMHFNTVFKLFACRCEDYQPYLDAKHILFLPDAINYYLTGKMVCEYSDLSTSAMMDPRTKDFDEDILAACGVTRSQFPEVVFPGKDLGRLRPEVLAATGLNPECRVTVVAGHDTGSAVAACPRTIKENGELKHVAYLSSGTWSLMGIVTDEPIITEESARLNFTNEGGVGGTTRVLKNITGMWILEQCRKEWKIVGKDYSHSQLIRMARAVDEQLQAGEPACELFNPDDSRFSNPDSMLAEVRAGRDLTDEQIVWIIYHSLAKRYGEVFQMLQSIAPFPIGVLYVIGGGVQNRYLLELTEKAVGLPVIAGTTEATALGNIRVQDRKIWGR